MRIKTTLLRKSSLRLILFMFSLCLSGSLISQTSNITQGCVPLSVDFAAPAGATSYYWDFMDGASANIQNPSNVFINAGTYVVEFRNSPTGPIVGTVTINVFNKPIPTFIPSGDTKGCKPLAVSFATNANLPPGVTATSYNWTYGEGSSGNGQNVNFSYNVVGVFDVSIGLVTNTPSCNNTVTYPAVVGVSDPNVNFTTNPNPPFSCTAPLNGVVFTNAATNNGIPMTYAWDLGNGNTSTATNPPSQDYLTIGSYVATLTVTDTNNCVKSSSQTISVGGPTASFSSMDTMCIDSYNQFVNNSTSGFTSWSFGPNAMVSNTTIYSPFNSFSVAGPQTVTLTVTSPGGACSDDTTRIIYIEDPVVTISAIPQPQCDTNLTLTYTANTTSNITNYEWIFDYADTLFTSSPTVNYHIWDSTYYKRRSPHLLTGRLVYTTSGGCKDTVAFQDTLHWVFGRFMPDKHYGCAPLTITFSDSSISNYPITNYSYDYGDGTTANFSSSTATNTHTYNTPGIYPVVLDVVNTLGCTNLSDTIWIEVGDVVPLNFSISPTSICPGESVTMTNLTTNTTNIDAWHYASDGELLSDCFQNPSGTFVFDDSVGVFDITLTGLYNGCPSTHTLSNALTVNGPIAGFCWEYDCADTMDVVLTNQAQGYTTHLWDFGDGTTSTQVSPVHTYAFTGDYYIKLTATNPSTGCPISYDSSLVSIRKIKAVIGTPSIICGNTPADFTALGSVDVNEMCNRGYKWIFSEPGVRPVTTSSPIEPFDFSGSGVQNVTLVVTDINGCTDTTSSSFQVFNVNAAFDINDSIICAPNTIQAANLSTADAAISSWQWGFPDGGSQSTQLPNYVIDTVIYPTFLDTPQVYLVVTDVNGCKDSAVQNVHFYEPISSIASSPISGHLCVGQNVQFSATDFTSQGSNLSYAWDFGDGNSSTSQNPSYAYSSDTTVSVQVIYTEIGSGCQDSAILQIDVQGIPIADYVTDVDSLPALCNPQQINFSSQSGGSAAIFGNQWNFSNGMSSTNSNPSFVFNTGTYTAQLIVQTSYGCKDTVVKSFTIIGPDGDFELDTNYICLGDAIQFNLKDTVEVGGYSWDFGDGTGDSDLSPISHNYNFIPPSGQTVAKLTVYGAGGACPVTVEKPVFIREVIADFLRNGDIDTTLCLGDPLVLTNTSLNSDVYNWDFGNGNVSTTSATTINQNYTYADTFKIYLDVLNQQYGCRDTMIKEIIVFNRPSFVAFDDTVCIGDLGYLSIDTAELNQTFSWTPTIGLNNATIQNPTANLNNTVHYQITVLDTVSDCSATDSASVYVIQDLADIVWDTTIVVGDSATLPLDNQNGFIHLVWTPPTGLSCYNCSNPKHQGLEETIYTVVMSDDLGCSEAKGTFLIQIFPDTHIDLPTTFSPNGDGVNDVIYLKGWGIKEVIYFQIFNRWGELVFESTDIDVGWDGYYKSILQNNDTYTYKAAVKTWRDKTIEKAGFINLMR